MKDGKELLFGVDAQHMFVVNSGNDLPVIILFLFNRGMNYPFNSLSTFIRGILKFA